jgi:hypothetical protein
VRRVAAAGATTFEDRASGLPRGCRTHGQGRRRRGQASCRRAQARGASSATSDSTPESTHSPSWTARLSGKHCAKVFVAERKQAKARGSAQQWLSRHEPKCGDGPCPALHRAWKGGGGGGGGGDGGGSTSHVLGHSHSSLSTQRISPTGVWRWNGMHLRRGDMDARAGGEQRPHRGSPAAGSVLCSTHLRAHCELLMPLAEAAVAMRVLAALAHNAARVVL